MAVLKTSCRTGCRSFPPRLSAGPAVPAMLLALSVLPAAGAQDRVFVAESAPRPPVETGIAPEYFRLTPAPGDTTFHLLVIPVRFPEDAVLGGGERSGILGRLEGGDPSTLEGFYLAATGGRLRVRSTLAPTVVAEHNRTYYTNEGPGNLGYGLDPNAYPHNAQRLVEEVTAKLTLSVDFARFDNTGDGIVDGLLLVHSGPQAPEAIEEPLTPDVLAAHAFTTPSPVLRGSVKVFPYAVVATRDPVGPWAHEVGHLLGLTDLYVANSICPDIGVGEWSLMATGANRSGGADPSGLDPWSRQWLGFAPAPPEDSPRVLEEGEFLRVFRPGLENGPRYFLVERRTGEDGLGIDLPAMVVYFVDEEAGDNRSCRFPTELYRPLVEVRAEICITPQCGVRLDDLSTPSLRDRDGTPTGLVLEFSDDTLRVSHETPVGAHLAEVKLSRLRDIPGAGPGQRVVLTLESDLADTPVDVTLDLEPLDVGTFCADLPDPEWRRTLAPGETLIDSTWAVVGCVPGIFPSGSARFVFTLNRVNTAYTRIDTVTLPLDRVGWTTGLADTFEVTNLNPDRTNPWSWSGTGWVAGDLEPLAYGEVATPWFSVPAGATLALDHAWDFEALSPDVSLDGGQVRLRRPLRPDVLLAPAFGWGFTAERKIGNALAGQEVLSGAGNRTHVLSLRDYPGDVARIVFQAAGDVTGGGGLWSMTDVSIAPAPAVQFSLDRGGVYPPRVLYARTTSPFEPGVSLALYQGSEAVTPVLLLGRSSWDGSADQAVGTAGEAGRRFELLWRTADGRADSRVAVLDIPASTLGRGILGLPVPNPLPGGGIQRWPVILAEGVPGGFYELRLIDVSGRLRVTRQIRVDTTGIRELTWDGRDDTGRRAPGGVYFLQIRRPDGTTDARKIVVLP